LIEPVDHEQIRRLAVDTLNQVGITGMFPTPLEEIQQHLRLTVSGQLDFLGADMPAELRDRMAALSGKLLGAVAVQEKIIYVDPSLPLPRGRYTLAHELGHSVIPWQKAAYGVDDYRHLSADVKDRWEQEANAFAADLLFGAGHFRRMSGFENISLELPARMCSLFGASFHATARRYVEDHPRACALVVFGRGTTYVRRQPGLRVAYATQSQSFLEYCGQALTALRLSVSLARNDHELAALAYQAAAGNLLGIVRGYYCAPVTGAEFDLEVRGGNYGNPMALVIPRGV
jgi:hypothetical protein